MPSPSNIATRVTLLLGVTVYLILCSFTLSATPILLGGDQAYFWTYAIRVLHGERIYTDFFQFTPPGTDLVYAAAFALFGAHTWVANMVVVATGVCLAGTCDRVASRFVARSLAALSAALFIVLIYGKALNGTHHWFSVLAIMEAVAVFPTNWDRRRILGAGALLGLASFFTQSHGAVALCAFALFAAWRGCREEIAPSLPFKACAWLSLGFGTVLLSLSAHFLFSASAKCVWASEVAYPLHFMASSPIGSSGWLTQLALEAPVTWHRIVSFVPYFLVYAVIPVVYGTTLRALWQKRRGALDDSQKSVALSFLVGVLLLAEVAANPNWLRLFAIAMPSMVLLPWVVDQAGRLRRPLLQLTWVVVACIGLNHIHAMHANYSRSVDLPTGRVFTNSSHREQLSWLAEHTSPGEYFFAATWPSYYFLLGLRSPVYLDVVEPSVQTRPEFAERAVAELEEKRPRYTLWSPQWDEVARGSPDAAPSAQLRAYVHDRYQLVHSFSNLEQVWQRK